MVLQTALRTAFIAVTLFCVPVTAIAGDRDTSRLVVIGGSLTEIVFALGKGDAIVGVDRTSSWPPEVKKLPQVGYYKKVSAEGVLSLNPSFVLAYHDAEPTNALLQIEGAGVPVATFERTPPQQALMKNIGAVGEILAAETQAARLIQTINGDLDAISRKVALINHKPRVLFLLNYDPSQLLVAGHGTIAAHLIDLAGGINVANDLSGYGPLNPEMVAVAAPDIIVTVEDRWESMDGVEGIKRLPGVADTPAGRADRFAALPGSLMLGLGPRIGEAVGRLARAIHGKSVDAYER